ncbi:hypothetical protein C4546_00350 [Candidatus Parcubacteria bacterium]|jgi:hypothetical protein|nr:MAG: hypothetical protein C4546_00350 [Candidatus Parcubacteria bacterium]
MELNNPQNKPQIPPKKGNSPTLWVVLIIVLLVAIAVAVYSYWNKNQNSNTNVNQNTNVAVNSNVNTPLNQNVNTVNTNSSTNANVAVDTSNWKTYSNTKYQYSFKYPKDFGLLDSPNSSVPDTQSPTIGFGTTEMSFRVSIQTVEACDSLSTCVQKYPYSNASLGVSTGLNQTEIDGHQALTETINRPQTGNWIHHVWYVLNGQKLSTFSTVSSVSFDTQALATYNAIIASIRF